MSIFARFTAETRKLTIFDHEYRTLAVDVVPYATPLPAALAAFGYALLTSDPLWSDDVYELAPLPTDATPTPAQPRHEVPDEVWVEAVAAFGLFTLSSHPGTLPSDGDFTAAARSFLAARGLIAAARA